MWLKTYNPTSHVIPHRHGVTHDAQLSTDPLNYRWSVSTYMQPPWEYETIDEAKYCKTFR